MIQALVKCEEQLPKEILPVICLMVIFVGCVDKK